MIATYILQRHTTTMATQILLSVYLPPTQLLYVTGLAKGLTHISGFPTLNRHNFTSEIVIY